MEADGAVDAQNAPTAPWKTLCVFHELPQGLSHQVTHEKLRKAPKYRRETRIDPYFYRFIVVALIVTVIAVAFVPGVDDWVEQTFQGYVGRAARQE